MTHLTESQVEQVSISTVEPQVTAKSSDRISQPDQWTISPRTAFQEFVEDHEDLLRRLAL